MLSQIEQRERREEIEALQARIIDLKETLRFYANQGSYRSSTVYICGHSPIPPICEEDAGWRARTMLKRYER